LRRGDPRADPDRLDQDWLDRAINRRPSAPRDPPPQREQPDPDGE
jgi:hypothetical protein